MGIAVFIYMISATIAFDAYRHIIIFSYHKIELLSLFWLANISRTLVTVLCFWMGVVWIKRLITKESNLMIALFISIGFYILANVFQALYSYFGGEFIGRNYFVSYGDFLTEIESSHILLYQIFNVVTPLISFLLIAAITVVYSKQKK